MNDEEQKEIDSDHHGSIHTGIGALRLLKWALIGSRPTVISGMLMLFYSVMQRNSCDELIHY